MKRFISIAFYLLLPLLGFAQRVVYIDMFSNGKIRLTLNSTNEFELIMYDDLPEEDNEGEIVAKGSVKYKNNMIICTDSKTGKKVFFVRVSHNDIIRAVYWNDYKNCSFNGSKAGEKISFSNLIASNPNLYIWVKRSQWDGITLYMNKDFMSLNRGCSLNRDAPEYAPCNSVLGIYHKVSFISSVSTSEPT